MIRLIVLAVIGYFAYRFARRWIRSVTQSHRVEGENFNRIDDVMIKDPQCGTYFPRRDAVSLQKEGKELLFCSRECRDKYIDCNSKSGG